MNHETDTQIFLRFKKDNSQDNQEFFLIDIKDISMISCKNITVVHLKNKLTAETYSQSHLDFMKAINKAKKHSKPNKTNVYCLDKKEMLDI